MEVSLILTFVFVLIVIYLLYNPKILNFISENDTETTDEVTKEKPDKEDKYAPKLVNIKSKELGFLCLDELNRYLYFSQNKEECHNFLMEYIQKPKQNDNDTPSYYKDRITLKSKDGYHMGLKYTPTPKDIYEVGCTSQAKNNTTILKLKHVKKNYLTIKFYNDHYLNIDENQMLYSSKNPIKLMIFSLKLVKNKENGDIEEN